MNRRTCLRLLALGGIGGAAGCLGSGDPTAGTATPTATASESETGSTDTATPVPLPDAATPAPGECEAETPPRPSPAEDFPDPRAYPEKPATIEVASVRPFLETYERAYQHNGVLADIAPTGECLSYIDTSVMGSTVTSVADGVTGVIEIRVSYGGGTCRDLTVTGTDTPTPLPHADLGTTTTRYYVTDRFLMREGTVRACWG